MTRDRWAVLSFAVWLGLWIVLSWAAIQDDALIHLRYADHLRAFHQITYDGVRPNFGTSSLLYVGLLTVLTFLWGSPELPRLVSSVVHVLLFAGIGWMLLGRVRTNSRVARGLSLILLAILVLPSSIRWLDDGMETGLVLCATAAVALLGFGESRRDATSWTRYTGLLLLGFGLVLLRSELAVLAGLGFLAIAAGRFERGKQRTSSALLPTLTGASGLVVGALAACATVVLLMGVLLPDTAIAKAEGMHAWKNVLVATAVVLTSSFGIGAGLLLFWLLTLGLVLLRRRLDWAATVVNLTFPLVLGLSAARGQAVQGVRYILWTLLFPAMWNILVLAADECAPADRRGETQVSRLPLRLVAGFAVLLLLEVPLESRVMYGVLTHRARTMRVFEHQHLEQISALHGVSMDIGYIGYFTQAQICDMSGLVNGRAVAKMAARERIDRCAGEHPQFAFGNPDQLQTLARSMSLSGWRVCGAYDFVNVRTPDRHYLVAPPELSTVVCRAAGNAGNDPAEIGTILPAAR